jgi:hypothetical protein
MMETLATFVNQDGGKDLWMAAKLLTHMAAVTNT